MLAGEQPAGPPEAGNHLIKNKQRPDLGTALPECRQIIVIRDTNAALALDGFDNDAGNGFVDGVQGREVVKGQKGCGWQQGLKRVAIDRIAPDRHGAECVAVKAANKTDKTGPTGILPGRLERALDRLRATIGEISHRQLTGCQFGQPARQINLGLLDIFPVDHGVQILLGLSLNGPDHRRMGMADTGHANTGQQVEIFPAAGVCDNASARPRDFHAHGCGRSLADIAQKIVAKRSHDRQHTRGRCARQEMSS